MGAGDAGDGAGARGSVFGHQVEPGTTVGVHDRAIAGGRPVSEPAGQHRTGPAAVGEVNPATEANAGSALRAATDRPAALLEFGESTNAAAASSATL